MLILRQTHLHFPLRFTQCYNYNSSTMNKNVYTGTILLPTTRMPLRLEKEKLIERDTSINKIHENIYKWQNEALKTQETFVLHDGPPYANGLPHMGHAINKILKDTIIRTKLLQGKRINYIPGWDCHGLPIELKAVKEVKTSLKPLEIRQRARNFAKQAIETQKSAFKSWGVIGDWNAAYKTFDKHYIHNQLQQFYHLYEKKLIYRDVKPVYWSPSSRTALAEAELEYNTNHISNAITLKLKVLNKPQILKKYDNVHLLIWTTTPWSIPSNQAVCYNTNLSYSLVKAKNDDYSYILASDLVQSHSTMLQKEFGILETFSGESLEYTTYKHPLYDEELKLLHAGHATSAKGTGLIHTAPAHGPEDFLIALEHNIKIKCLVDENGKYTKDTGLNLEGVSVLDGGNSKIIDLLGENVVHSENFVHTYPYDWRTKKPVILRASQQWFIDMDPIKEAAIKQIEETSIIPAINGDTYKKNLIEQIKRRPYWCISRQRCWGVPIPVFYKKNTREHILSKDTVDQLCKVLYETDTDFWWKQSIEKLLPQKYLPDIDNIQRGEDILDIWFDSGISWSSVLHEPKVADMYLEGVDQFTGWFQSSLITSVGLRNHAPYKAIYVHGFALDDKGVKMSKSLGNVVDPQEIMGGSKKKAPYGIDTLRWWVACHANQDSTTLVGENVLKASASEVQKIRSTLRFALGSLGGYNGDQISYKELNLIDKYMLHLLYDYHEQAQKYLAEFQFHRLSSLLINLIANEISAIYYTAIKDRLYCDEDGSATRLAAQFVLLQLLNLLTQSVAPIVPHLAEEVHLHLPESLKTSTAFFTKLEHSRADKTWRNDKVQAIMALLLDVRKEINKRTNASEAMESEVELFLNIGTINAVEEQGSVDDLCDILQVSKVVITQYKEDDFRLEMKKGEQCKCPRCRKFSALMPETLCNRCYVVVQGLRTKSQINN